MPKSDAFETDMLDLVFNAVSILDIAEDEVASPATTLAVGLHVGDPGEAGTMATTPATYGGYLRQTPARTSGGWTVGASTVSPAANIDFPEATSGSETITHFSIGTGVADNMMYYGTVTPNIVVVTGVTPRLTTASTITEE